MSEHVNYHTKKHCEDREFLTNRHCKSCKAIFQSSILDDTIYCDNCREDEDSLDVYSSSRDWDDIVNTSCRTSPVFYD